jgi:hypothetical protein
LIAANCLTGIPPKFYDEPSPSDSLWRYLDLAKYISLLHHPALYFYRADKFSDPFEGAMGDKAMKSFGKSDGGIGDVRQRSAVRIIGTDLKIVDRRFVSFDRSGPRRNIRNIADPG